MDRGQGLVCNSPTRGRRAPLTSVPDGYQRTDLGVIPAEWSICSVGELFDCLITASKPRADLDDTGDTAYVHYGDIHTRFNHFIDFSRDNVPRLSAGTHTTATQLRNGDLIVADASEDESGVGKSVEIRNLGTTKAVSGLHTFLLRPKDRRISEGYRGYLLEKRCVKEQLRRLATGLKVFGISKGALKSVLVPLPPPSEQRAIAEVLSDVERLLGALEAPIVKKRAMKQAAMQQLLTGTARLPSFWDDWKRRRIGDICTFLPTANNPRSDFAESGDVEYIHYGDIHAHTQPTLDCRSDALPRIEGSRVGNAARLMDGDLVMVDASEDIAGVGKSIEIQGTTGKNVVAGLHTIVCRGSSDQWAIGFKAYLQFIPAFKAALAQVATGISVYAISKNQVAGVEVPLPAPPEQEAIVSVLSELENEIAALEERRDKTLAVKQGMMQQLLTGRVRLV